MGTARRNTRQLPASSADTGIVAVAVCARDPVAGLGAVSILRADGRLKVLDESELAAADVLVVVEDLLTEEVFTFLRAARAASSLDSPPPCVIVTDHFRREIVTTAIECGMAALVRRYALGAEELVRTILSVSQGPAVPASDVLGDLRVRLGQTRRAEPHGLALCGLSTREREVLRLLAEGRDTEEIAAVLAYSESAVKYVLYGILSRYNLNSRAHAVAFALRAGLI
ncbi:response regulator transcription factor [Amycolatopsis sp. NPDC059027]|uniref:helix-turn-helix transcriptional regulator n=1 Tax=unclassified Amycolatopsis TaxID=2618356 RepID=UPI00366E213F